jgi:hypothetical protein
MSGDRMRGGALNDFLSDARAKLEYDPRTVFGRRHSQLQVADGGSLGAPEYPNAEELFRGYDAKLESRVLAEYGDRNRAEAVSEAQSEATTAETPDVGEFSERAETLAALYLPDEPLDRRSRFVSIYTAVHAPSSASFSGGISAPDDMAILRAYFMFEGDVNAAVSFLASLSALCTLGFGEEEVVAALSECRQDRDLALDHLLGKSVSV